MSRKNADYVGRWNLRCVYRRCGDKWEIVEDHRNFIEQVSWDFRTTIRWLSARSGKIYFTGHVFLTTGAKDWKCGGNPIVSCRIIIMCQSTRTLCGFINMVIVTKTGTPVSSVWSLVPQQDSLMQNTLNRIIGLTRLQSVTQYPIETIRSLRITDPDRQIILPDSDTGLFVSRMTDDHVAMAVFLHVFV